FAVLGAGAAAAVLPWLGLRRAQPEGLPDWLARRRRPLLMLAGCAAGLLAAEWAARAEGFTVVDLLDDFKGSGLGAERLRVSADDWHPNA
ncbi:MAG: hypothetical protein PHF00_08635, partial [Elusimicrobia bacterium]|nr:hypothetical protein [Elusimicrobiota bacterium]